MATETGTDSPAGIPPEAAVSGQPRPLRRILWGALYLLYLGIVLEGGARLIIWPDRSFNFVVRGPYDDESSNRLAWARRHHGPQKFYYSFFVHHPVRGWAVAPNVRNMSVFQGKILNSNSRGFRGETEYLESPPVGKKRIVVLGDSFTFGDEVSDNETYAHYLETLLPDTEVMNLGVGGYGHDQILLYLEEEGVKYHPDIVLLGFCWVEMPRNLQGFASYWKPRFVLRNGELVLTHVPVPRPEEVLRQEIYRSKSLDLGLIFWHRFSYRLGLEQNEGHEITVAIFDEMVATCRRIGATPVIAYLPVNNELVAVDEAMSANELFLSQYCESRRIPCAFLRPNFSAARKRGVDLYWRGHWRPDEHLIAAHGLKDFLVQKGLVPAPPESAEVASPVGTYDRR